MSRLPSIRVRVESSIRAIPAEAWDACAFGRAPGAETPSGAAKELSGRTKEEKAESPSQLVESNSEIDPRNPFVSHAFLASLEESGTVAARTGWLPQHIVVEDKAGEILAAMPCYMKSHSQGEYVFDHGWADAFERAGGQYYPKLQAAVPFTPVTGPRLLVRPHPNFDALREALTAAGIELAGRRGTSSLHITFPTRPEWEYLTGRGLLARTDRQFHWLNAGYRTFDDFLAALSSRKRKNLMRERREAQEGVEIVRLTGSDLTEEVWDAFFDFYMDTGSRKWGRPYLNRAFFSIVSAAMADRIVLILARRHRRWIAGALNFLGQHTLYGRYWGATEHRPFLHFELCYYQAIEHAIEHKLARVEAGAQGPHKIARGYLPVTTYSSHYIVDPGFRRAVANYLEQERAYVKAEAEELAALAPFRKNADAEEERDG
ncbi:MAG: N-acetyltransferase [Bradyrhizobiaceae bacterium]|nr:N-acetyltransferase [Bradyrhizobiaceae bacterium]